MNHALRRLFVAGACLLTAAFSAHAQMLYLGDDSDRPSHRPLDTGVGDLKWAEDRLAERLGHTRSVDDLHDLIGDLLKDEEFQKRLEKQLKDVDPQTIQGVRDRLKNNPDELINNPEVQKLLKEFEKQKKEGRDAASLPPDAAEGMAKAAKELFKRKMEEGAPVGPIGGPPDDVQHPGEAPHPATPAGAAPVAKALTRPGGEPQPSGVSHEAIQGMARWFKDFDRSPEGEALRTAALRELAKLDANSSGPSSDFGDFLKNFMSSDDASWLAKNLKLPSAPNFDGWSMPSMASGSVGAPSLGADSAGGAMGALVWVVAVVFLGAAAWMAVKMARRQAAAARANAWSAGPWPVRPSEVSTRHDLIRAFEYLAHLLLGPTARSLNHLDAADRLGQEKGDVFAAARLARLYEQARYAPSDEPLDAADLTAARRDLSALAGAAA